jgi:hypothetical protein
MGKRELAADVTGTRLLLPDKELFDSVVKRRHTDAATLLRDIVHQWCVKTRLAPDTTEGQVESTLLDLQKETKNTVDKFIKEVVPLLRQLADQTNSQGELFHLSEVQLNHIAAIVGAHYNVSAQTFAALWSLLQMFERVSLISAMPATTGNPQEAADKFRDANREEGLRMVEKMTELFKCPHGVQMVLIFPGANSNGAKPPGPTG